MSPPTIVQQHVQRATMEYRLAKAAVDDKARAAHLALAALHEHAAKTGGRHLRAVRDT